MRNYKKGILTIISLNFVCAYLLVAIVSQNLFTPFFERAFWFLPILSIVPSFLLSMLITVLFYKEGRENKIQFYCQLSGLILMVGLYTYTFSEQMIDRWQYETGTNYLSIEDSPEELEKALQVIRKQLDTTTKFNVSSYWVSNDESEEVSGSKPSYAIYFTYYLNADYSTEYFSKLAPHENTYKVEVLNGNPKLNPEVSQWRQKVEDALQDAEKASNEK